MRNVTNQKNNILLCLLFVICALFVFPRVFLLCVLRENSTPRRNLNELDGGIQHRVSREVCEDDEDARVRILVQEAGEGKESNKKNGRHYEFISR